MQTKKKPELQDFGIDPEKYALYEGHGYPHYSDRASLVGAIVAPFVVALVTLSITGDLGLAVGYGAFGVLGGSPLGAVVFSKIAIAMARSRWNRERSQLLESPIASQIKLYESAMATYTEEEREAEKVRQEVERVRLAARKTRQDAERSRRRQLTDYIKEEQEAEKARLEAESARRSAERAQQEDERARRRKLIDHWLSLSGSELEDEMATLCSRLGYGVEFTPVSGDGGVDLILRDNNEEKVVVQCKSYKSPVGPAAARELYGSMMHFGADRAVLVCPTGFTRGVEEFVKDKQIDLVSVSDLIRLAASAEAVENGADNGIRQR